MGLLDFLQSDRTRFMKAVAAGLAARGVAQPITFDANHLVVNTPDADRAQLGASFKMWRAAARSDKADVISRTVSLLLDHSSEVFEDCSPHLVPLIVNRSEMTTIWMHPADGTSPDTYEGAMLPMCGSLAVMISVERPQWGGFDMVNRKHLEKWGKSFDAVLAIAVANLASRGPARFLRAPDGFYVSSYQDHRDTGRLLLHDHFSGLDLKGDPVAIAVCNEILLVAGSQDMDALNGMAIYAGDPPGDLDTTSTLPIVLRDGAWHPFDTSHIAIYPLDNLRSLQTLRDNDRVTQLLSWRIGELGEQIAVPPVQAIARQGHAVTWTAWPWEVDALLPEAEVVIIEPGGKVKPVARSWNDVVRICGPFEPEPHCYPPRYRTQAGQSEAMWEALLACPQPEHAPEIR